MSARTRRITRAVSVAQPADTYDVIGFADGGPHRVFMRFRGGREA
jgi:hypothetical protein